MGRVAGPGSGWRRRHVFALHLLAILEYWIPAEDLTELNASIVGTIEVVAEYR